MRIRAKILAGCLSLAALTGVLGVLDIAAERRLGQLDIKLYDQAFMAMSYLRSAQNSFTHAKFAGMTAEAAHDVQGDLQVARERALSQKGARAAAGLMLRIGRLAQLKTASEADHSAIERDFNDAVEIMAADSYRHRREAGAVARETVRGTVLAIAASLGVALLITALLTRSIVPRLRVALGIAEAIAAGRLDLDIRAGHRDETGALLGALAIMQASLAEKIARIDALLAEQKASHASETALRSARFEAALDNMSQGLCLFDAQDRLIVANRRFSELFGAPCMGQFAGPVFDAAGLALPAPALGGASRPEERLLELDQGRVVAVAQQRIAQGGFVATFEDITERRQAETRLAHLARHDSLTGLPNRAALRDYIATQMARVRRGEGLAVLCLNLDQFKTVNDTFGHEAGDALLKSVASRLREAIRQSDLVARTSADDFVIVQCQADQPGDATALATRLADVIAAPVDIGGLPIAATASISIGIAIASHAFDGPDALLNCAELALCRAKTEGRGIFRFFEPEMDRRMRERRELERDLRQAIAGRELSVYYQPLIQAGTRAVQGFEALVRWCHPKRGMLSPGLFIPLAEEVGLIGALGEWVLRQSCQEAVAWPGDITVAVNLSPLQFRDRSLAHTVQDALAKSGLPASRLELEITESVLMQDDEAVLCILHDIKRLGVSISMDDFGTGYSSLSYLQRFPFDKIKIDQSFVRGLSLTSGSQGDCLAIVRAVIGLGRSLGISVLAEGVETAEQCAMLVGEGCTQMQGYLFSPPQPAADVPRILASARKCVLAASCDLAC